MPPLAFFLLRSKAAALMLPSDQIDRERYLPIRQKIPPQAMQHIAIDADDANSLPAQPGRLPGEALPSPCHHGMKADEQQQSLRHQRPHLDYRLQRYVRGML